MFRIEGRKMNTRINNLRITVQIEIGDECTLKDLAIYKLLEHTIEKQLAKYTEENFRHWQ